MNTIFQVVTMVWTLQGGSYFNESVPMATNHILSHSDAGTISEASLKYVPFNPLFLDFSAEFQIPFSLQKGDKDQFFIGGGTESRFFPSANQIGFEPFQQKYIFDAGIRIFGIEIGYQHMCLHPVTPEPTIKASDFFDGYDKVYAKISGSL